MTPKKKKVNPKAKGNSFELEIAKYLSQTFNESFLRCPGSGAYVGGKNSVRKEFLHEGQIRFMKGDIIPPPHWIKLNVECKSYAEFPFHQLFTTGEIKLLEAWIDQTITASDINDLNLIFMKFNRKGQYTCFEKKHLDSNEFTCLRYILYESTSHGTWVFTEFSHFWENNTDKVKELST